MVKTRRKAAAMQQAVPAPGSGDGTTADSEQAENSDTVGISMSEIPQGAENSDPEIIKDQEADENVDNKGFDAEIKEGESETTESPTADADEGFEGAGGEKETIEDQEAIEDEANEGAEEREGETIEGQEAIEDEANEGAIEDVANEGFEEGAEEGEGETIEGQETVEALEEEGAKTEGVMEDVEGHDGEQTLTMAETFHDCEESIQIAEDDDALMEDANETAGVVLIGDGNCMVVGTEEESDDEINIAWIEDYWNKMKSEQAAAEDGADKVEEEPTSTTEDSSCEMIHESEERMASPQNEQPEDQENLTTGSDNVTADPEQTDEGASVRQKENRFSPLSQAKQNCCIPRAYFGPAFDKNCFQFCVRIYPVHYGMLLHWEDILMNADSVRVELGRKQHSKSNSKVLELLFRVRKPLLHKLLLTWTGPATSTFKISHQRETEWTQVTQSGKAVKVPTALSREQGMTARFRLRACYFKKNVMCLTKKSNEKKEKKSLYLSNLPNKKVTKRMLTMMFPLAQKIECTIVSQVQSSAVVRMRSYQMVVGHLMAMTNLTMDGHKVEMRAEDMSQEDAEKKYEEMIESQRKERLARREASTSKKTRPGKKPNADKKNTVGANQGGINLSKQRNNQKAKAKQNVRNKIKNLAARPQRVTGTRGPGMDFEKEIQRQRDMRIELEREMERERQLRIEREVEERWEREQEMKRERRQRIEREVREHWERDQEMERERQQRIEREVPERWERDQEMERERMLSEERERKERERCERRRNRREEEELERLYHEGEDLENFHQSAVLQLKRVEVQQRLELEERDHRRKHEMERPGMQQQRDRDSYRQQQQAGRDRIHREPERLGRDRIHRETERLRRDRIHRETERLRRDRIHREPERLRRDRIHRETERLGRDRMHREPERLRRDRIHREPERLGQERMYGEQNQREQEGQYGKQDNWEQDRMFRKRGRFDEPRATRSSSGGPSPKRGRGEDRPRENVFVSECDRDGLEERGSHRERFDPTAGQSPEMSVQRKLEQEVAQQAEVLKKSLALLGKIHKDPLKAAAVFGELQGDKDKDRGHQPPAFHRAQQMGDQQGHHEAFRAQRQEPHMGDFQRQETLMGDFQRQETLMGDFQRQETLMGDFQRQETLMGDFQTQEPHMGDFQRQETLMGDFQRQEPHMGGFQRSQQIYDYSHGSNAQYQDCDRDLSHIVYPRGDERGAGERQSSGLNLPNWGSGATGNDQWSSPDGLGPSSYGQQPGGGQWTSQ